MWISPLSVLWGNYFYSAQKVLLVATVKPMRELLVVPVESNTATISFDYELAGSPASYVVPAGTVGDWEEGKQYIYTVNVGADETEIVPTVTPFVEEEIPAM